MAKLFNLARMTCSTKGAGLLTLGVAVAPYLTFAQAGVQDGDIVSYSIIDISGGMVECGIGTYTAAGTTLSRTPRISSNSNVAINLSGNAQVFISALSEDIKPAGILSVKDFGAVGDGVTDDTAAIQAAINAAGAGTLYQYVGLLKKHLISSTLLMQRSNTVLLGLGGDFNHNVGFEGHQAGTQLIWGGASNGIMVDTTPVGGASSQINYGCGAIGIYFEGASLAGKGLVINELYGSIVQHVFFNEFKVAGLYASTGGTFGETSGVQMMDWHHIGGRQNVNPAPTIILTGDATNNTSVTVLSDIDIFHINANGVEIRTADAIHINHIRCYGTGTGNCIRFFGSATSGLQASNCIVTGLTANTPAIVEVAPAHPVTNILIWDMDKGNNTPAPTDESGGVLPTANCNYSWTDGRSYRSEQLNTIISRQSGTNDFFQGYETSTGVSWKLNLSTSTRFAQFLVDPAGSGFVGTLWMGAGYVGLGTAAVNTTFVQTPAGTTARSSFSIPEGVAPTSPVNGDFWNAGAAALGYRDHGTSRFVVFDTATQTLTNKSIDAAQLTGTIAAARLPNPSASTLGGIESIAAVSHQWINSISTSGVPALSQPAQADISGLTTADTPSFAGETITADRGLLFTNQTTSAAAQVGTITNAPAAGNPGFWLRIKIGGTSYAIPCWAG